MGHPDITVVLPTYNRAQMLSDALESLMAQETGGRFSFEVLVVDDASTDQTATVVEEVASLSPVPVRYVQGRGEGYSAALNSGLNESRGEWLAFFDDDQLAGPSWLRDLYSVATGTGAQLVGGPVALVLPCAANAGLGPVYRALCGEYPGHAGARKQGRVPLPPGGNRLVHRAVFRAIGAHDESFLTGGADRDLAIRARAAGLKVGWAPAAVVRHLIGPERVKPDHMRSYCLQAGASRAHIDWKRRGGLWTVLASLARSGHALLLRSPQAALASMRHDPIAALDARASRSFDEGYVRGALCTLAPRLLGKAELSTETQFRALRRPPDRVTQRVTHDARTGQPPGALTGAAG